MAIYQLKYIVQHAFRIISTKQSIYHSFGGGQPISSLLASSFSFSDNALGIGWYNINFASRMCCPKGIWVIEYWLISLLFWIVKEKIMSKYYANILKLFKPISFLQILHFFITHCGLVMPYGAMDYGQYYYYFWWDLGDVRIIPSFWNWGYVLHVEHVSCVIMNCGQHLWAIPSLFSIAL